MKPKNIFYSFKIYLIGLLCWWICSCSSGSKNPCFNDWQRMNLKGSVKQIDLKKYYSYQDLLQKLPPEKSFIRFNEKGLITQNAVFVAEGKIHWTRYDYREDSVYLVESTELANKGERKQSYWWYTLDARGAQTAVTSVLLDSSVNFHIDMILNEDGNPTEIIYSQQIYPTYMPCRIVKTYDKNGKIKEELAYLYNETTRQCNEDNPNKTVFKLNEQGDIEREIVHFANGTKQTHSYQYKYDEKGNWTEKLHYNGDIAEDVIFRNFTYY